MVEDRSQQVQAAPSADGPRPAAPGQAVTGVVPPQLREARVREAWPTLVGLAPGLVALAKKLIRSVFLAPLGWGLLAPLFLKKFAPFVCNRYTVTNRRLMIQKGWKPAPAQEVKLEDIDEVRLVPGGGDDFYHAGDREVLSAGKVVMTLAGVPEPEGFRQAVVNAVKAWVPGKATGPFLPASAEVKA